MQLVLEVAPRLRGMKLASRAEHCSFDRMLQVLLHGVAPHGPVSESYARADANRRTEAAFGDLVVAAMAQSVSKRGHAGAGHSALERCTSRVADVLVTGTRLRLWLLLAEDVVRPNRREGHEAGCQLGLEVRLHLAVAAESASVEVLLAVRLCDHRPDVRVSDLGRNLEEPVEKAL